MTTLKDIIDEITSTLHGFGETRDRITSLKTGIGVSDPTFIVDAVSGPAMGITPGPVQIDSEQLYVTAVDPTTGICTLANGFGRGFDDTTAATHSAGAKIISRPKFPRIWIQKQVNEVIGGLFPDLFAVATYTNSGSLTVTYPGNTYILPAGVQQVLDVQWQDVLGQWIPVFGYKVDMADSTFRLGDGPMIGRPLRIVYSKEPNALVNETDDFVTVTGLPASTSDLLVLGVVARQAPGLDTSRAQSTSVESSTRSSQVAPNTGLNIAKSYQNAFDTRLDNEARSLRRLYRPRMRRDW